LPKNSAFKGGGLRHHEEAECPVGVKDSLALSLPPQHVKVVDEAEEEPKLMVDETKICRSFINILKNAFDAMPNCIALYIAFL